MATNPTSPVLQHLRRILPPDEGGPTDGQLLARFLERRDEAAFAALVKRHGRLVWNVCRRLLGPHDAEDAFQATFLVLCRKAASIRRREVLASWLYGVARQTALQARRAAARRRAREKPVGDLPEPAVVEQELWSDLRPLLDQELGRLPENYQVVLLLCDLEGQTRKEAARQLGLPEGTVASRLARARALLAQRLARHGLAVCGGTLAALLARRAVSAPVPASVVSSTLRAAAVLVSGQGAAAGAIPARVVTLTNGVMKTMLLTKLKLATVVLAVVTLLSLGTALLGLRHLAAALRENREMPPDAKEGDAPARPGKEAGEAVAEVPTDPEARRLAGAWTVRHVETNGKPLLDGDDLKGAQITFEGARAEVKGLRVSFFGDFSFRLDPAKTPKEIDVTLLDGAMEGKTFAGIYAARGDELRLCLRLEHPELGRPKGFATSSGTTLYTFVLDRAGEDSPAPQRRGGTAAPKPAAAAAGVCRVCGTVTSTEYARAGGTVDRSIVYVTRTPEGERVGESLSRERAFAFDLPPGRYELQCTANGSRGATFEPAYKVVTVKEGDSRLDLGAIDLAVSATTKLFGKPAPELTGVMAWKNTEPLTLRGLRGQVVVLDFWAYTCSICLQHKPDLARLAEKYKDKGLAVLTVHDSSADSIEEVDRKVPDAVKQKAGHLPVALDGKGDRGVFRAYGIRAVPAVILIDQDGTVVRRFHHAGDPELDAEVARLLKGTK
jgi:RNA polymerase sigma factor (sigma-70 family)